MSHAGPPHLPSPDRPDGPDAAGTDVAAAVEELSLDAVAAPDLDPESATGRIPVPTVAGSGATVEADEADLAEQAIEVPDDEEFDR
jgi:hypothetical protein